MKRAECLIIGDNLIIKFKPLTGMASTNGIGLIKSACKLSEILAFIEFDIAK
jgi:hypothetical protein